MQPIYLDHNASAPLLPAVAAAMHAVYGQPLANPSSPHAPGRRARRMLEDAREAIAARLGARLDPPIGDRLIFTSGGTEANNLALRGLVCGGPLVVSSLEHPSTLATARHLAQSGTIVRVVPARPDGGIDLDAFACEVARGARLACLMLANNETGVMQPVAPLAEGAHRAGCLVMSDACQVVGKLPVDFAALGVDALSVAAHKFHGPVGIGALLVRGGIELAPYTFGGAQELGARPGTEAVAMAVGFQAAIEAWHAEQHDRAQRMTALRDRLEQRLLAECPQLVVHGRASPRLPHTSNIAFVGVDRQALLLALDLANVACSAGSACASGSSEPSPTLLAMGCPEPLVRSSLRFSLGATTTEAEVDQAADRILKVYKQLQHTNSPQKIVRSSRESPPAPL